VALHIDLNADLGESYGAYVIGDDEGLMRSITSANIAAGFHGGDPSVLRETVRLAKSSRVAVGAHPGLPDLAGFGRRHMHVTPREAEDLVLYQVAAVAGVAAAEGVRIRHVKPHGALYVMAAKDAALAGAIARAVVALDRSLVLVGPPGSQLLEAGRTEGLRVAAEAFADRAYNADGTLVSRTSAGAVLTEAAAIVGRAIQIVEQATVVATTGDLLPMRAETLCVHGDTPGAAALAAQLRAGLEAAGILVAGL
jgi:UPF0271 protein